MMTRCLWLPRVNSTPAAWPSFSAISGVMGAVLAVPLIPSVPNSRRLPKSPILSRIQTLPDAQSARCPGHVMDPEYMRAKPHGKQPRRQGFWFAPGRVGLAGDFAQKPLAREADEQRMAQGCETRGGAQEGDILNAALGEAESGVERDGFRRHPRRQGLIPGR